MAHTRAELAFDLMRTCCERAALDLICGFLLRRRLGSNEPKWAGAKAYYCRFITVSSRRNNRIRLAVHDGPELVVPIDEACIHQLVDFAVRNAPLYDSPERMPKDV